MDRGWHPPASRCKPPTSGPHYEVTSLAPLVSSLAIALIYSMTLSDYCIDLLNDSSWLSHWFTQQLPSTLALIYSATSSNYCIDYSMTASDYCIDLLNDFLPQLSHWFTLNPSNYCTDLLNDSLPYLLNDSLRLLHWFTQWLVSPPTIDLLGFQDVTTSWLLIPRLLLKMATTTPCRTYIQPLLSNNGCRPF